MIKRVASNRMVPAAMMGASPLREGIKLRQRQAGKQAVMTPVCDSQKLLLPPEVMAWRTAIKFSPIKLIKTVQIASCCVQIQALT